MNIVSIVLFWLQRYNKKGYSIINEDVKASEGMCAQVINLDAASKVCVGNCAGWSYIVNQSHVSESILLLGKAILL